MSEPLILITTSFANVSDNTLAQVTGEKTTEQIFPVKRLRDVSTRDWAFTYIHSRNQSDTDTGSNLANIQSFTEDEFDEAVPTVSDSYGVEVVWLISDLLVIGAWGGLSKVTTLSTLSGQIDRGTQDIWNWAVILAFPDLGKEGSLGGQRIYDLRIINVSPR